MRNAQHSPQGQSGRESYIVRIWREPGSLAGWRGQVVVSHSQQTVFFESFVELTRFLEQRVQDAITRRTA